MTMPTSMRSKQVGASKACFLPKDRCYRRRSAAIEQAEVENFLTSQGIHDIDERNELTYELLKVGHGLPASTPRPDQSPPLLQERTLGVEDDNDGELDVTYAAEGAPRFGAPASSAPFMPASAAAMPATVDFPFAFLPPLSVAGAVAAVPRDLYSVSNIPDAPSFTPNLAAAEWSPSAEGAVGSTAAAAASEEQLPAAFAGDVAAAPINWAAAAEWTPGGAEAVLGAAAAAETPPQPAPSSSSSSVLPGPEYDRGTLAAASSAASHSGGGGSDPLASLLPRGASSSTTSSRSSGAAGGGSSVRGRGGAEQQQATGPRAAADSRVASASYAQAAQLLPPPPASAASAASAARVPPAGPGASGGFLAGLLPKGATAPGRGGGSAGRRP